MAAPSSYGERFVVVMNMKFPGYIYCVNAGRKYDKIVMQRAGDVGGRSVHAFVDRTTGDVFKAAGWNKPAPDARANVADFAGLKDLAERADKFGSYLYKR